MATATTPCGARLAAPRYTFTVFTGTWNRRHTLARPYESLKAQTLRDFEWLVIDNGSTDGTPELMAQWIAEAPFPIRYLYQSNRGQHGSANRAAIEATGELFLRLDSDDRCAPNALERFKHHWDAIPAEERAAFVGVTVHTTDENGAIHGMPFPRDVFDSDSLELRLRYRVHGENWGFTRTDVLREFPLPEIDGYTGLMPSSIAWNAIAHRYKTRYVNESLKIWYRDQAVTLSEPADDRGLADAPGAMIEARSMLNEDIGWLRYAPWTFVLKAAKYSRSAAHCGVSIAAQARALTNRRARLLWAATLPLGRLIYVAEKHGVAHLLPGPRERSVARRRRQVSKNFGQYS